MDTGKAYMEHGLVYAGVQYVITIDILMSDVNIVQLYCELIQYHMILFESF